MLAAAVAVAAAVAAPLHIYSSLPLHGNKSAQDVARGEQLALEQSGRTDVQLISRDDSTVAAGKWDPGRTQQNARDAAQDPRTVAYIGEYNSGATANSLPILNEAGILQVSPINTYPGLTHREGAEPGEPDKYYPTGKRTYVRVSPHDGLQAGALVSYLKVLRVRRVFIADDREIYGTGLARMVERRLRGTGIRVTGRSGIDARARNYRRLAVRIRRSRAQAMLFGGISDNNAAQLYRDVHRAAPRMKLLGADGVLNLPALPFTVYVTYDILDWSAYPQSARDFEAAFKQRYGFEPDTYGLYGFEAMRLALDALAAAGDRPDIDSLREAMVAAAFATRDRDSPLGRYSIDSHGDATVALYGGYTLRRANLRWSRALATGAS